MASVLGGDKLDAALSKIADNVKKATGVEVGFLSGATYPNGTPVAMVAAIQEFGAPGSGQRTSAGKAHAHGVAAVAAILGQDAGVGIPPRPFFRNMIAAKSGEWPAATAALLKANNFDAAKTLDQVGAAIAGQLRQSIVDFTTPPLKPSTIKAKGFDKPLIDTGLMSNSIDHKVT